VIELEQREALRADLQIFLYQFTRMISDNLINYTATIIINNDKRLF
jgi:hypothetical protein